MRRPLCTRLYEGLLSACLNGALALLVLLPFAILWGMAPTLIVLASLAFLVAVVMVLETAKSLLTVFARVRFSLRTLMGFVLALGFFAALAHRPEPGWHVGGALGILGTLAAAIVSAIEFDPERKRGG